VPRWPTLNTLPQAEANDLRVALDIYDAQSLVVQGGNHDQEVYMLCSTSTGL